MMSVQVWRSVIVVVLLWLAIETPESAQRRRVRIDPSKTVDDAPASVCVGTTDGTSILWIAQSSAGAANGTSAGNARAMTYFTTAANWGGGGAEIDAGDTVCLTGTITSNLAAPASGSAGNVVTIDGTNATISTSSQIDLGSVSYLTFTHLTVSDGHASLVFFNGSTNITIDDCYTDLNYGFGFFQGTSDITIRNCYIRSANDEAADQFDLMALGNASSNFTLERNYLELRFQQACGSCHDDIFQTFISTNMSGLVIRYNYLLLSCTASNDRSWLMLEGLAGTNSIYGNVFVGKNGCGVSGNGISSQINDGGHTLNIFQNTMVAKDGPGNLFNLTDGTFNVRGNIVFAQDNTALTGSTAPSRSYNNWVGSALPSCGSETGSVCGTVGSAADPDFTNYTSDDFSLQSSSPAKNAGNAFGAPYDTGIAPGATWPVPTTVSRPQGAAWDIGAVEQ
jgi:parallel beta helix pectate lyase-like protein